jgi:hypothetical protein
MTKVGDTIWIRHYTRRRFGCIEHVCVNGRSITAIAICLPN